jgi:NlpC/P60 family putative phage cell wall peptidase
MTTRADVVAEARRWERTPWRHQARTRGVGTDCGGLVGGVAVALGLVPPDWWATTFDPRFGGYGRRPVNDTLRMVCRLFMDDIDPAGARPGDVVLMRFHTEPQHLGIVADYRHGGLSLIHALSLPPARVAEHRLAPRWRDRVVDAFAYRGLAD